MRRFSTTVLLAFVLVGSGIFLSGCYSSRITTDAEPSNKKIEKPWATGFLYGLATPGATINASQRCDHGVAVVETKISFLNLVASNLTFGLYTPMDVTITCAEGGNMSSLMKPPNLDLRQKKVKQIEVAETMQAAVEKSAITQEPVKVQVNTD